METAERRACMLPHRPFPACHSSRVGSRRAEHGRPRTERECDPGGCANTAALSDNLRNSGRFECAL